MKKILYILFVISFVTCNGSSQTKKTMKTEDKSNPELQQTDESKKEHKAFIDQEHRFELNGCELKYNGKAFKLGMTLQEFEEVFGEYKTSGVDNFFVESNNIGITASKNLESIIGSITISFEKEINYIIVNNSILSKGELMQDFVTKSPKLTFKDFVIDSDGYIYEISNCDYLYFFISPVVFNRIGEGHMVLTGKPKLDETNPIKSISINYNIK